MFCILIILITPPNSSHVHAQINPHSYKFLSSFLTNKDQSILFKYSFLLKIYKIYSDYGFFSLISSEILLTTSPICVSVCMLMYVCVLCVCVLCVCMLCFAVVATAVHAAADVDEDDNNDYLVLICLLKYSWVCDLPLTCD